MAVDGSRPEADPEIEVLLHGGERAAGANQLVATVIGHPARVAVGVQAVGRIEGRIIGERRQVDAVPQTLGADQALQPHQFADRQRAFLGIHAARAEKRDDARPAAKEPAEREHPPRWSCSIIWSSCCGSAATAERSCATGSGSQQQIAVATGAEMAWRASRTAARTSRE